MFNSVSPSTLNANKEIYILQEQLKRLFDCLKYIPVNYSHFFRHLAANLLLYQGLSSLCP